MDEQYIQSTEELEQHLTDIIEAIKISLEAYDRGSEGEAKRLATSIRVLVYDTKNTKSISLLKLLNKKSIKFYDSSVPLNPESIMPYSGLICTNHTDKGTKYKPILDDDFPNITPRWVTFDEWWNGVIVKDINGDQLTRKDLVCSIANKDGGAHVDIVLDKVYAELSRHNSLGGFTINSKGSEPIKGAEKAIIRQIAHEILKTLNPDIPKIIANYEGITIGNIEITWDKPQNPNSQPKHFLPM
jgi:hypothetical protein